MSHLNYRHGEVETPHAKKPSEGRSLWKVTRGPELIGYWNAKNAYDAWMAASVFSGYEPGQLDCERVGPAKSAIGRRTPQEAG